MGFFRSLFILMYTAMFCFTGLEKFGPYPDPNLHQRLKREFKEKIYPEAWNFEPFNQVFRSAEQLRCFISICELLGGSILTVNHFIIGLGVVEWVVLICFIVLLMCAGYTHVVTKETEKLFSISVLLLIGIYLLSSMPAMKHLEFVSSRDGESCFCIR
mmetsp:Transcript_9785/g.24084  ORF Transcript_9785/g.24084 Transcript_9785/m.24084 type:complete len:158 (-) Transcript_9785:452-925(-)